MGLPSIRFPNDPSSLGEHTVHAWFEVDAGEGGGGGEGGGSPLRQAEEGSPRRQQPGGGGFGSTEEGSAGNAVPASTATSPSTT